MPFPDSVEPADLRGVRVESVDGVEVGKVTAIHVEGAAERIVLLQVGSAAEETQYIVPVAGASFRAERITVDFAADMIMQGPMVAASAVLSIGELGYVLGHYRAGAIRAGRLPLTARISDVGDVDSLHPDVRRLPPVVIIRPAAASGPPSVEVAADG